VTRRLRPGFSIDWWCELFTTAWVAPANCQLTVRGKADFVLRISWQLGYNVLFAVRDAVSVSLRRSWISVPPRNTFKVAPVAGWPRPVSATLTHGSRWRDPSAPAAVGRRGFAVIHGAVFARLNVGWEASGRTNHPAPAIAPPSSPDEPGRGESARRQPSSRLPCNSGFSASSPRPPPAKSARGCQSSLGWGRGRHRIQHRNIRRKGQQPGLPGGNGVSVPAKLTLARKRKGWRLSFCSQFAGCRRGWDGPFPGAFDPAGR